MARVAPSLALVAYADAWLSAAKVIVFGDALSALPEQLIERGARLVSVYDSDPARVAEATQRAGSANISFAPLEQAGSLARDGAFDVGIIEDVGGGGPQSSRLVESLARALGRRGVALIATRNAEASQRLIDTGSPDEALGYYPLHELVRAHFAEVRMLGQAPFVGYAIVDFGADAEEDINIDTGLVPGGAEQPEWFVAVASQRELGAESFSVIQLPFAGIGQKGPRAAELERARASEKRALARIAKLESEQAEAGVATQALQTGAVQSSKSELERLRRELGERDKWLAGLEARASTADQRADDMQLELERLREQSGTSQQELERLRGSSSEAVRAKTRLEEEKNVLRQELLNLRKQLEEQRQKLEEQRRLHDDGRRLHDDTRRAQEEQRRQEEQRKLQDEQRKLQDEQRRQAEDGRQKLEEQRKLQLDEQRKLQEDGRQKLEDLRRQHDDARRQYDELRKQHDELKRHHDEEQRQKAAASAEQDTLRKALVNVTRQLEEQTAQVEALNQQVAQAVAEPHDDIARLEEQLQERGREVARLEQAMAETERFGKQLIVQLEALKQSPGDKSSLELDRLAQRNAELEANLESARWTIAQLESAAPEAPKAADSRDSDANVQRQAVLLEQARPSSG